MPWMNRCLEESPNRLWPSATKPDVCPGCGSTNIDSNEE